jgi:archaellum component FlaC
MAEIESYVGILIDNNKGYAEELHVLRKENTDLRGQVEVLMGDLLRVKEGYEEALAHTKAGYAEEVGGLIDELKDILHKKEQMEGSYKSLLEELTYQSESARTSHAIQMGELERNYESKLRILNDRIQDQNREL